MKKTITFILFLILLVASVTAAEIKVSLATEGELATYNIDDWIEVKVLLEGDIVDYPFDVMSPDVYIKVSDSSKANLNNGEDVPGDNYIYSDALYSDNTDSSTWNFVYTPEFKQVTANKNVLGAFKVKALEATENLIFNINSASVYYEDDDGEPVEYTIDISDTLSVVITGGDVCPDNPDNGQYGAAPGCLLSCDNGYQPNTDEDACVEAGEVCEDYDTAGYGDFYDSVNGGIEPFAPLADDNACFKRMYDSYDVINGVLVNNKGLSTYIECVEIYKGILIIKRDSSVFEGDDLFQTLELGGDDDDHIYIDLPVIFKECGGYIDIDASYLDHFTSLQQLKTCIDQIGAELNNQVYPYDADVNCEAEVCVPSCDGKSCGDDGCGGSCGECDDGESCNAGACEAVVCDPACDPGESCENGACLPGAGTEINILSSQTELVTAIDQPVYSLVAIATALKSFFANDLNVAETYTIQNDDKETLINDVKGILDEDKNNLQKISLIAFALMEDDE
jgi:hypothetical protein